jgi:hypothetical protein
MNIAGLYTSGTLPLFMAALLKFWLTELVLVALPGSIIGAVIYWLIGRWYVSLVLSYAAAIVVMHYAAQHLQFSPGLIALLSYSLGWCCRPSRSRCLPDILSPKNSGCTPERSKRVNSARSQCRGWLGVSPCTSQMKRPPTKAASMGKKRRLFSLLRVAGRGRDAIDGLTKNTLDIVYRAHGSHDGAYRIHPGAAANGVQIVDAQFVNFVAHVSPLSAWEGPSPHAPWDAATWEVVQGRSLVV